jgi:uncharacterized protein YjbJ (UPF0337 family)
MDRDRITGSAKQIVGNIKERLGRFFGDRKTQAKGTAQKTEGKAQNTVGGVKDTARETVDSHH